MIKEALDDPSVQVGYKLSVYHRAERLRQSKQFKVQVDTILNGLRPWDIREAPKVCIHILCVHYCILAGQHNGI